MNAAPLCPLIYTASTFAQPRRAAPGTNIRQQQPGPPRWDGDCRAGERQPRGYAFASGLAAISTVLGCWIKTAIWAVDDVYGGTWRLIENVRRHSAAAG